MSAEEEIRRELLACFAEQVGVTEHDLLDSNMTLATLVLRSPRVTNSLDLMEAFGKTVNVIRKNHGVRIKLPTYPLDTKISVVLEGLVKNASSQVPGV